MSHFTDITYLHVDASDGFCFPTFGGLILIIFDNNLSSTFQIDLEPSTGRDQQPIQNLFLCQRSGLLL